MKHPEQVDITLLNQEPDIEGSVQNLFRINWNNNNYLLCQTTESGSVFDVGTIFSVPESDILRTIVRHFFYTDIMSPETWQALDENDFKACYNKDFILNDLMHNSLFSELKENGVKTHHVGMIDSNDGRVFSKGLPEKPSNLVLIKEFPIFRPIRFGLRGNFGWDYSNYFRQPKKILALENVFRLGSPGGSSLQTRYDAIVKEAGFDAGKEFLDSIGLDEQPRPWYQFSNMLFDCATKYEPEDRHLSWQETIHLSGVPSNIFKRVIQTIGYCTIYLNKFFRKLGYQLWDVKWEVAVDEDEVVIVDTIDPDSIRVTGSFNYKGKRCFVHFNKQAIRDYYRFVHEDWYQVINQTKKMAKSDPSGKSFMEL